MILVQCLEWLSLVKHHGCFGCDGQLFICELALLVRFWVYSLHTGVVCVFGLFILCIGCTGCGLMVARRSSVELSSFCGFRCTHVALVAYCVLLAEKCSCDLFQIC